MSTARSALGLLGVVLMHALPSISASGTCTPQLKYPTTGPTVQEPFYITGAFDSGNIKVLADKNISDIKLEILKDPYSSFDDEAFFQWFYFRAAGRALKFQTVKYTLVNAGEAQYADGFPLTKVRFSYDQKNWKQIWTTKFDGKVLTWTFKSVKELVYFSYTDTYSYQDYLTYMTSISLFPNAQGGTTIPVRVEQIGTSYQGRPIDLITIGTPGLNKVKFWYTSRIHPGEVLPSYTVKGITDRMLSGGGDKIVKSLIKDGVVYLVPMANPDGVFDGNHRSSAQGCNLNRLWTLPNTTFATELFWIQKAMKQRGLDVFIDLHMDESEQCNFIFWPAFGVPGFTEAQWTLTQDFNSYLKSVFPMFTNTCGYPPDANGTTPLYYSDAWTTNQFKAIGGTLEMPFTDVAAYPDPEYGWNSTKAAMLGSALVDTMEKMIPGVKKYRNYK